MLGSQNCFSSLHHLDQVWSHKMSGMEEESESTALQARQLLREERGREEAEKVAPRGKEGTACTLSPAHHNYTDLHGHGGHGQPCLVAPRSRAKPLSGAAEKSRLPIGEGKTLSSEMLSRLHVASVR